MASSPRLGPRLSDTSEPSSSLRQSWSALTQPPQPSALIYLQTDLALPVELWLDILSRMDSAAICSLSLLSYFHRQLALPSLFATLRIDHTTSTDALRDLSRRGHILKHVQNVYLCALYPATPESDADMQRVIVGFRLCLAHMHQLRLLDLGNVVVSEYLFREIFTLHTLRCIATGPHAKAVAGVTLGDRSETLKRLSVFHIESAPLLRILEPAIKTTAMSLTNLLIPLALFGHLSILQRFTAHPPPRLTSIAVVDLACPTDYAVLYDFLLSVPNVTQLDIRSATCVANNPSFSTVLPKLRVLTCPAWLAEHLVPGRPLCTFKETPVLCIKPNVEHLTIFQNILSASPLGGTHPGGLTTLILSSSCQWGQYVSLIKGALLRVRFLSLCMLRGSTEDLVSPGARTSHVTHLVSRTYSIR